MNAHVAEPAGTEAPAAGVCETTVPSGVVEENCVVNVIVSPSPMMVVVAADVASDELGVLGDEGGCECRVGRQPRDARLPGLGARTARPARRAWPSRSRRRR